MTYSDFIIYVDESGDHSLDSIDRDYPVFVLDFCIFRNDHYAATVAPVQVYPLWARHKGDHKTKDPENPQSLSSTGHIPLSLRGIVRLQREDVKGDSL